MINLNLPVEDPSLLELPPPPVSHTLLFVLLSYQTQFLCVGCEMLCCHLVAALSSNSSTNATTACMALGHGDIVYSETGCCPHISTAVQ